MIQNGNTVNIHYTGKLEDGTIFDSSIDREPLSFIIGSGQIIQGFEDSIIGKNTGDKFTTLIKAVDAYGEYRDDLCANVPNTQLPGEVEVGTSLQAIGDDGFPINVIVKEIYDDYVIIDANHPFAGKDLTFDIEILSIS